MPLDARQQALRELAASNNYADRILASRNPDCPADALVPLAEILNDGRWASYEARGALAHRNYPVELLREKALGPYVPYADVGIYANPNLPGDVIGELLSNDDGHRVSADRAGRLLAHPNCPPDVFEVWVDNEFSFHPRRGVASNLNCPPRLQVKLARDKAGLVRAALAENPNCCGEALEILMEPESIKSQAVQVALIKNGHASWSSLSANVEGPLPPRVRTSIAQTTSDVDMLRRLALDGNKMVRKAAAKNPLCPEESRVAVALLD